MIYVKHRVNPRVGLVYEEERSNVVVTAVAVQVVVDEERRSSIVVTAVAVQVVVDEERSNVVVTAVS